MKRIAILLDGGIANDGRVQRVINSLSDEFETHLFYCGGNMKDDELFNNKNIHLHRYKKEINFLKKNLFFHKVFDDLIHIFSKLNLKFDLIYSNDYPLLSTAVILKKRFGIKLVYDTHEIYIETINQFFPNVGWKSFFYGKSLIWINKLYHRKIERQNIKNVDFVITVCESFQNYFKSKYQINNIEVLRNCPDDFSKISRNDSLHKMLGLNSDSRILLYQGVMNQGRGLFNLIEAAKLFDENIHFVLVGDGPISGLLKGITSKDKITNVHFTGKVPFSELLNYTASADVGILLIEAYNLSKKLTLPNKVFEYMAAGIPVITNNLPEASKIVEEENCGYVIDDSSVDLIAKEINKIFSSLNYSLGQNGFEAICRKYNWKVEFEKTKYQIENLLDN